MASCNEIGISRSLKRTAERTEHVPLKVTLIADEWLSRKGGLSTINRELAIELAKSPFLEVSLFMPKCSDKERDMACEQNIKVFEAQQGPGKDPNKWWTSPPEDLRTNFIIGHGVKLGKQAKDIKEHCKCLWVQVVHTEPEELGNFKEYDEAIAKGEAKFKEEVALCKNADLVVGIGPKLAEAYSARLRPNKKVFPLTPGIFKEFLEMEQAQDEGGKFRVLTFGRGDPEDVSLKGFDLAAEAVALLQKQLYDKSIFLIFLGVQEGKHDEVKERLRKHDILEGRLKVREFCESREELAEVFREVDLVIMPSRSEGFGLTALEALSAGLPILVGWNTGLAEALKKKVEFGDSCVVKSDGAEDWAEAIDSVRKKPKKKCLEEAKILRENYEKAYPWSEQCKDLVEEMCKIFNHDGEDDKDSSDEREEIVSNPAPPKRYRGNDEMQEMSAFSSSQLPSTSGACALPTPTPIVMTNTARAGPSQSTGNDEMQEMPASSSSQLPSTSRASAVPIPTPVVMTNTARAGPSQSAVVFKEGKPSDLELDELAGRIGQKWEKLGVRLGISFDVLDERAVNANDKPLAMLQHWRNTTNHDTPYRELYAAMCHSRVGLNNLAKEFCCKPTA